MNVIFYIFSFHIIFSKSGGYFIYKACLNSEAKFLLEVIDMHFDFIKFIIDKVGLHIHVVWTYLGVF